MLIQGSVGQPSVTSIQPGTTPTLRQGQLGEMVVQELHGRYYETAYRRNQFFAATQGGITTSAGLTTAVTGLILTNPTTSTVNCVVNKVGWGVNAAPTAVMMIGLAYNTSTTAVTQTTAITPRNCFLGAAAPQGLVASSVTLPTAGIISHVFGAIDTGAVTTVIHQTNFIDLEGSIVMPPGSYLHIYTSTASAATSFFGSFQWEEVPV
ncbi:hypothetical protein UFOVP118_78 [uncultured Caudovirales phage]|uniref:Uncharacterized protein n=1 Tax=uncultured Caudovirales phage TaxID=2100421 RepID=A0A6J5L5B7_9CAUD|nr:hypothetical protein UFOVP118_78 [uncultured Caudovirales phage]